MARRSKTKLKGGPDTDRMMRAAESGHAARSRAQEQLTAGSERQLDRAQRQGESVARTVQSDLAKKAQEEQFARTQAFREEQAAAGQEQFQQQMQQRRETEAGRQALTERGQNLQAAAHGMEPTGRAERLQADMQRGEEQMQQDPAEQQRRADQGSKPLEFQGGGGFKPTEEATKAQQYAAETKRIQAKANMMNAQASFDRARLSGNKEAMKQEAKNLEQPLKSSVNTLNRAMKDQLKPSDFASLKQMYADVPDGELQKELEEGVVGPRIISMMRAENAKNALTFISATGDMPDGDLIDMTSPQMQEWTTEMDRVNQAMRMMGAGSFRNINSLADKNRYVRKTAAALMLRRALMGRQASQEDMPEMAGQQPPGQPPIQVDQVQRPEAAPYPGEPQPEQFGIRR